MRIIADLLKRNKDRRLSIHIVGDSMIDEYYSVRVTRISPESPNVCVMLNEHDQPSERVPGGAANVCYQLMNFNVDTHLVSWTDAEADKVFKSAGIDCTTHIQLPDGCQLPRKKRFFDGDSQVGNRWDIEKKNCGLKDVDLPNYQTNLFGPWLSFVDKADVVIFSDYNKGLFSNGFPFALPNKPIIVDPKKGPLRKWLGCTIFKPNSSEAIELSGGLTNWREQCDYFQSQLGCQSVVITQGGDGVVGKSGSEFFSYSPIRKVSATKVIGAGDCFVGVLALAVGHDIPVPDASKLAFEAGLIYVQDGSHDPLTPWQLQKQSKFVTPDELRNRTNGGKLVFTNGCFDILHSGHLESLRFAKSKGDKLVVAVNSDASVSRLKGPKRPVISLNERMELLAALEGVDYVISFEEDTPQNLIEYTRPDVLIKGADWEGKTVAGSDVVKEVYFVPLVNDKSTTNIIGKIKTMC